MNEFSTLCNVLKTFLSPITAVRRTLGDDYFSSLGLTVNFVGS